MKKLMKRTAFALIVTFAMLAAPPFAEAPVQARGLTCEDGYNELKAKAWSNYMACLAQGQVRGGYFYYAGCVAIYEAELAAARAFLLACYLL